MNKIASKQSSSCACCRSSCSWSTSIHRLCTRNFKLYAAISFGIFVRLVYIWSNCNIIMYSRYSKNIRIIEFCSYSAKKWDIISLKGISDILPLNSENQLKIISIAKHPAYSNNRFSRQLDYLRILFLREARSRKVETNRAVHWSSSCSIFLFSVDANTNPMFYCGILPLLWCYCQLMQSCL